MNAMQPPSPPATVRIEATPPQLLTAGALARVYGYGFLLMVPVLVSMLVISVTTSVLLIALLLLATVALVVFFLPFGFGNPAVVKMVRSLQPASAQPGFVVQVTLAPRLHSGLRTVIEDADDIGWLSFTETSLVFVGDALKLSIPFAQLRRVKPEGFGRPRFFLYRPRLVLAVSGVPNLESLEFTERSSWVLPASLRIGRELYERLGTHLKPGD